MDTKDRGGRYTGVMITDRLWSVGFVLVYALGTWVLFLKPEVWWSSLLVGMVLVVYVHSALGLWYQYESFGRRHNPNRVRSVWFGIIIASVLVTGLSLLFFPDIAVYVGVFVAFLVHALENEITAITKRGLFPYLSQHTLPLIGIVVGFFLTTVAHTSVYFHRDFIYSTFRPAEGFVEYATHGYLLIAIAVVGGMVLALRHRQGNMVCLYLLLGGIAALLFQYGIVIPYVYFISSASLYHIAVWFVSYLRKVSVDRVRLRTYLIRHGAVGGLLVGLVFLHYGVSYQTWVTEVIFSLDFFIVVSLVHIATSALNEPFAERWVGKVR